MPAYTQIDSCASPAKKLAVLRLHGARRTSTATEVCSYGGSARCRTTFLSIAARPGNSRPLANPDNILMLSS